MRTLDWKAPGLALAAALGTAHILAWASGMTVLAADKPQAKVELPAGRSETMKTFDAETRKALAGDYQVARYHPIHFKPAIDSSNKADCLTCHANVLTDKVRAASQAGQDSQSVLAWYQTLDSYSGQQEMFHWRHIESPLAKEVMKLECNFCHQGYDPREQSPAYTTPANAMTANNGGPPFTLRKRVNPEETCLKCHGAYPFEIMGLSGPWHEQRVDLEPEGTPNGCLTCHAGIRTSRHNVTYLNKDGIEKAAENSSDVCYGCHGGRQWYRISYPYPRNPWPDMDKDVPDWAKTRPTKSDPRYAITGK